MSKISSLSAASGSLTRPFASGMKFGAAYARALRRLQSRLGDIWNVDEVCISIRGGRCDLWRAVDQDGDVLDIPGTHHRNARAARRFCRKLWKGQGGSPFQRVADMLRGYAAALRELGLSATHRTGQYDHNTGADSHQHTWERERRMRPFTSEAQVQRFFSVHCPIQNLFRVARHRLTAIHYRLLRQQAFTAWEAVTRKRGAIGRRQEENRV